MRFHSIFVFTHSSSADAGSSIAGVPLRAAAHVDVQREDGRHRPSHLAAHHHLCVADHCHLLGHDACDRNDAEHRCAKLLSASCTPGACLCGTPRLFRSVAVPAQHSALSAQTPGPPLGSTCVCATHAVALAGTAGIAFMALPSATMPQDFAQYMASSSLAAPTKFAVGFPLVYHWFGAIRHAVWDLKAWGFSNQAMLQSSYALAGASVVVSLGLAAYSMPVDKSKKKK